MKKDLVAWLGEHALPFKDLGPSVYSEQDDYPEYAEKLSKFIARNPDKDRGILLCRSGIGVAIVANKFKGIRASLCWNEQVAKSARVDDDANVLCLPADYVSPETAQRIVNIWLETQCSSAPRHQRRIAEITKLES